MTNVSGPSGSDGIIRDASNQREMEEKLLAREQEAEKRVLEKHKVTREELPELITKELVSGAFTSSIPRTPVDHGQIKREPSSREVQQIQTTLKGDVAQRTLEALHGKPQSEAD